MTHKTKARILFVYPNERHMSTIPPAISLLSQLLKDKGHETDLFDTTFYEFEDDININSCKESWINRFTWFFLFYKCLRTNCKRQSNQED